MLISVEGHQASAGKDHKSYLKWVCAVTSSQGEGVKYLEFPIDVRNQALC